MLNPIGTNRKYLINYAIVWSMIIGAHFAVLYGYYDISAHIAFWDSFIFNVFFAFLGLSLWYVVRYNKTNHKFLSLLTSHLLSSLILIGFWLMSGYLILRYAINNQDYLQFLDRSFPWRIISGIFYYSVFTLGYYVVIYYLNIQDKIKQESRLKSLIKEAELSALKHQINPHFLFNSLNSVSSLTITSPEKAQEMIIKLSDYLRYSLSNEGQQIVGLETELANIALYLEIEKIRFGKRLDFRFNYSSEAIKAKVPVMILQPLFENAIKHGVYESLNTILIKLDCEIHSNMLQLIIHNNYDSDSKKVKGAGIGLRNIKDRLFLLYKTDDLLEINKTSDSFTVTINIPQNDSI